MNLDTGHPEIDKQHHRLAELVQHLESVCETKRETGKECVNCKADSYEVCNDRIASLMYDLLVFMMDHFSYEDKLMKLLPDTEECRNHVLGHQLAHAEVSRLLSELTASLDQESPLQSSRRLWTIVSTWLGQHAVHYDTPLATTLDGAYGAEMNYDKELSRLLGS